MEQRMVALAVRMRGRDRADGVCRQQPAGDGGLMPFIPIWGSIEPWNLHFASPHCSSGLQLCRGSTALPKPPWRSSPTWHSQRHCLAPWHMCISNSFPGTSAEIFLAPQQTACHLRSCLRLERHSQNSRPCWTPSSVVITWGMGGVPREGEPQQRDSSHRCPGI